MRRTRLFLIFALGLAVAFVVVRRLLTPTPAAIPESRPAPVVERPKPPLQADAVGSYVPGYSFAVNGFRFTGFSLRPEALVTFASSAGSEQPMGCLEAQVRVDTVHLRCEDRDFGTVTIDGKFLTRLVTTRLDAPVLSAIVTVRSTNGEILYRARDSFVWRPGP
jgi:hypothetical protein